MNFTLVALWAVAAAQLFFSGVLCLEDYNPLQLRDFVDDLAKRYPFLTDGDYLANLPTARDIDLFNRDVEDFISLYPRSDVGIKLHFPFEGRLYEYVRYPSNDDVDYIRSTIVTYYKEKNPGTTALPQMMVILTHENSVTHEKKILEDDTTIEGNGIQEGDHVYASIKMETGGNPESIRQSNKSAPPPPLGAITARAPM